MMKGYRCCAAKRGIKGLSASFAKVFRKLNVRGFANTDGSPFMSVDVNILCGVKPPRHLLHFVHKSAAAV